MTTEEAAVETKDTIPLWLAVAITVVVSLPFAIWLEDWNLPIWVSFIVWAEYFVFGGKWRGLLKIIPAYIAGVVVAGIIMTGYVWLNDVLDTTKIYKSGDIALGVACFVGFCAFIYLMKYVPILAENTLPFFNGISMGLAVYFTGAFVAPFSDTLSTYLLPTVAGVGALLAGLLGAFLGWFNVAIMFPRPVRTQSTRHLPAGPKQATAH